MGQVCCGGVSKPQPQKTEATSQGADDDVEEKGANGQNNVPTEPLLLEGTSNEPCQEQVDTLLVTFPMYTREQVLEVFHANDNNADVVAVALLEGNAPPPKTKPEECEAVPELADAVAEVALERSECIIEVPAGPILVVSAEAVLEEVQKQDLGIMVEAALEPSLDNKPVVSLEATVEVEELVEELVQESFHEVSSDLVQETTPEIQVSTEGVVDELLVVGTSPEEAASELADPVVEVTLDKTSEYITEVPAEPILEVEAVLEEVQEQALGIMAEAALEPSLDNKPVVSVKARVKVEEPVEELVQETSLEVISDSVQETTPEPQESTEAVVDKLLVEETNPEEAASERADPVVEVTFEETSECMIEVPAEPILEVAVEAVLEDVQERALGIMDEAALEPSLDNKPVVSVEATVEVEEPVEELVQESLQEVISDLVQEATPKPQESTEAVVDELLVVETSTEEVAGTVEVDMVPSSETVILVEEAPEPTSEAVEVVAVEVAGSVEVDMVPSSEAVIVVEEAPEPASEAVEVIAVEVVGTAEADMVPSSETVIVVEDVPQPTSEAVEVVAVEVAGKVEADMVPSSETVIIVEEAPEPTSEAVEVVAVEVAGKVEADMVPSSETVIVEEAPEPTSEAAEVAAVEVAPVEVAGTIEADMVPTFETVIVVEEAPEPTSEAIEVVVVEALGDDIIDKESRSANAYIESVDESSGVVVITEPSNTGLSSEWVAVPEVIRHD